LTTRQQWAIGIIVAIVLALIPITYEVINSLPAPKLDVKTYGWYVNVTTTKDNTTYTGLNATFPAYITNIGNVPVHVVVCDVFLSKDGKPSNLSDELLSEIAYLKPDDSFPYNFTKHFDVSMPVNTTTPLELTNYLLLVGYYTQNLNDIKYFWIDPSKIT
jgi:hypothetical protein